MDGAEEDPMILDVPRLTAPTSGFKHRLAALVIKLAGWAPEGAPPALPQLVVVAAPHTSLMDGFWMNAFAWYWGVEFAWLVRRSMTQGPLGYWLRYTGAVPIDRDNPQGLVAALAETFKTRKQLFLALSPEGTRGRRTHWKSGFYRLSQAAGVPMCLSFLDYTRKRAGFGPCLKASGSVSDDMDFIRSFYKTIQGKFPEQFTPPRLSEEDRPPGSRAASGPAQPR
jgi:1-acyl-sn-glycerol-3-phosphate acyltransferase